MGKCSTFWFIWHSMTVPAFEPGLFNNQPFFRFHSNISKWVNIIIYTEMESTKNRLTLKLEILDDFPASAKVWFTQFTMMSSFTFCPSPRSSSTFNVYLKEWTGCELIMNRNYWTTGSDHTHLHTQGKNITCWRGQDCLVVTWQPSVSQLSAFVRESHFLLLLFHWEFFFFVTQTVLLTMTQSIWSIDNYSICQRTSSVTGRQQSLRNCGLNLEEHTQ